jgi:monovalent cation/hydrogen antiporter
MDSKGKTMHGWHEMADDGPGLAVVCGHLRAITQPDVAAIPLDACHECLTDGTTWVELRRCLVCGHNGCCESSPQRHATAHFEATGHPIVANDSNPEPWGWCFVDGMALAHGD